MKDCPTEAADLAADYKASPAFQEWRAGRVAEVLASVVAKCDALDHLTTVSMLAAMVEDLGAGSPTVPLLISQARADAEFWVDSASPMEVEAYTAAGLRAITRRAFCLTARKRLLVGLWNSLSPEDRRGFLAHAAKTAGAA